MWTPRKKVLRKGSVPSKELMLCTESVQSLNAAPWNGTTAEGNMPVANNMNWNSLGHLPNLATPSLDPNSPVKFFLVPDPVTKTTDQILSEVLN